MKAPCVQCKRAEKMPSKQRCVECQQHREPAAVRERWADWRLAAVPEPMRQARVPERDWPPGRRWCAGCQSFVRLADCNKGASQCKACSGRKAHASMLTRTYMIHGRPFTADDYETLFREQKGRCRICGERPVKKRLAVEHDHVTNEVRGLCCPGEFGCNFAIIGNLERRGNGIEMARRVLDYLEHNYAHSVIPR